MKKNIAALLIALTAFGPLAQAAKIQQQGIKTHADCVAAGASDASCLPLTSQIYDSANAQQLSLSITNGQLGGGGGSKNYLASYVPSLGAGAANTGNGDFELNATTGWSLAHTSLTSLFPTSVASATVPFDSTHGGSSASGNLSFAIESAAPIQKKYSGKLVSSAASTAGDMLISSAFYIDSVDQSQPMTITLGSNVTSGAANLNFSGTSSNSFAIYVYDVTGATWIQPSGVYGMVSSGVYNVKNVVFQPVSSTSTRYQLAFININASAGAYTLLLDAIGVGPQAALSAPAMMDMTPFTPTGTWTSNATYTGSYGRQGDMLVEKVHIALSGAPTATSLNINLPNGLQIDTTKQVGQLVTISGYPSYGTLYHTPSVAPLAAVFNGVSQVLIIYLGTVTANAIVNATSPFTLVNGDAVDITFSVPIVGWSSNTVSSADTDTKVIAFYGSGNPASATSGNPIIFPTATYDNAGAYNTTTGRYAAPVAGFYRVHGFASGTAAGNALDVYVNAVAGPRAGLFAATFSAMNYDATVQVKAGDLIDIRPNGTEDLDATSTIFIERVSGPAVVQATESVNAYYSGTPTGTLTNAFNAATFPTKTKDTHNGYSGSTYTVAVSGSYSIAAQIGVDATYVAANRSGVAIYVNGSVVRQNFQFASTSVGSLYPSVSIPAYPLNAGDTVVIRAFTEGTSPSFATSSANNSFSIARVGN